LLEFFKCLVILAIYSQLMQEMSKLLVGCSVFTIRTHQLEKVQELFTEELNRKMLNSEGKEAC
jgi:hypothetical protein